MCAAFMAAIVAHNSGQQLRDEFPGRYVYVSLSLSLSPDYCLKYIYRNLHLPRHGGSQQYIAIFFESKGLEPNRQYISHFVHCC